MIVFVTSLQHSQFRIQFAPGEWGYYEGDLDTDGDRQGTGKMTYTSGNSYEGPFVGNKYHGDKGIYKWADNDVFEGQWRNGERDGFGIFTKADGEISYANYDQGETKGEGIQWNADRSSAHKMEDGEVAMELLPDEAEKFAKEKFNLPVPDPVVSATTATTTGGGVASTKKIEPTSMIKNLFSSKAVTADGKLWFHENGKTLIELIVFVTSLQHSQFTIQFAQGNGGTTKVHLSIAMETGKGQEK